MDFLLELLSEEIPARMQEKASADLARLFAAEIAKWGLKARAIESFVTPRRLALIARDLPPATEPVSEELKGPRADAPAQAIAGFLAKARVTREQLVERADAKGNAILFAIRDIPPISATEVLANAVFAIVRDFPWPKSMRWGARSGTMSSLRWVRPLQGIVALFGDAVVPGIDIDGIEASAATVGHRFHHPGVITIGSAADYVEKLRACHVIVDSEERRRMIRDGAGAAAAAAGLALVPDEGLVAENAGLTEWPVPLLGHFDPAFLAVPREVIQLTMRANQKYFACTDASGALAPAFVCTANITPVDGGAGIVAGNAKVLAARLSDARFFWEQDLKVPLAEQARKLAGIVFHEKLGTVADKVERVAKLAEWLASEGIVPDCDPALARRAAELCKADLVTGMVGEFPELQGVMGGYYARAEGLPDAVADAIRDHYKPVGQGDEVPTAPVTVAVSLADKLDTLSQFFAEDLRPTGSKDPFALRRAGLGIIELLNVNAISARLFGIVNNAIGLRTFAHPNVADGILQFLIDRLKVQQREAGVRHDLIDAVFALGGEDDLVRLLARVTALQAFVETGDGANLLAGYRRAANILKAEAKKDGTDLAPFAGFPYDPDPAEAALADALAAQLPKAEAAIARERFAEAMTALSVLRPAIDRFFGEVTVNSQDGTKRLIRLALLDKFRAAMHNVADFSRIEG